MKILPVLIEKWKPLATAVFIGVLLSLATGLVERGGIGIPGIQNYGYPWTWRTTNLYGPTTYHLLNLAGNLLFWTVTSLAVCTLLILAFQRWNLPWDITVDYRQLTLFLILFIPLGLVMDLVHEGGHALWGILAGGHLTKLQIAYFQLYPTLAFTPNFRLGYAVVQGLSTDFARGLMLLGGSLSTHIAAWIIGIILVKTQPGPTIKLALFTLGLFGILDLPLYTFLPQLGLRHWIIIGGHTAEPLIAAQKLGVPNVAFSLIVVLATLPLTVLYHQPLRKKLLETHRKSH
ncbi:MAG: hypothetical protein ACOC6G_01455 [Thermoproteota archaeon]